MNTYAKYTANVFVAKCEEQHEKGETIILETQFDIKYFIKEVKEELKYMGYLQRDLAKLTYIPFARIKTILNGSESTTEEEINSIKKVLGL